MTAHEKAIAAINARLERLQANLRTARVEAAQRFLFQSIVATIAVAEALNDYAKSVGAYARRRHADVKQTNESLGAQHAELLKSGQQFLEKFKANPGDRDVRRELERVQREMAAIQKTVRRGANALQRELAPSLGMVDQMAISVRRLSESDGSDALKRVLKSIVGQVRDLYSEQAGIPARDIIDAETWEKSAIGEIDQAADFHDAYARTAYQAALALELMAMAVSENPPRTGAEANHRANEAAAVRIKEVAARFTAA